MKSFVHPDSIVRRIWGRADTILFIFAGAAAEFSLNKAVDWLYYTGRLPADPIGRLFSTVVYARRIVFSSEADAIKAIREIASIHKAVETRRGYAIPDEAYLDVLFMLIDYSIRSFELLERRLTLAEKEEIFDVFYHVGFYMGLSGLPINWIHYERMRARYLQRNLEYGEYTRHLYGRYRKSLGSARFFLLVHAQVWLVPVSVRGLLTLARWHKWVPLPALYKGLCRLGLGRPLKLLLLPSEYADRILALDRLPSA